MRMETVEDYRMGDDEYVVCVAHEVHLDERKAFSMPKEGELTLTNENIVYVVRGMLGKTKRQEVYPLSGIRLHEGLPLVRLDTSEFMTDKLEITFESGVVRFVFGGVESRHEVRTWVTEISRLIAGDEAADEVAHAAHKTMGERFDDAFDRLMGVAENAMEREIDPVRAVRCPSCNASLEGHVGETITCPYCGAHITVS